MIIVMVSYPGQFGGQLTELRKWWGGGKRPVSYSSLI